MIAAIRKKLEQREEGFTLIELLIVVIIIGILAAVAIPTFLAQRERGWAAAAQSDARNVAIQLETFLINNGTYGDTPATASFPLADPGPTVPTQATNPLTGFKPSKGVYIAVASSGVNYCIATRHASSPAADTMYLQNTGSLTRLGSSSLPTTPVACPAPGVPAS
jgi:type IV pilus assembly protein PilA